MPILRADSDPIAIGLTILVLQTFFYLLLSTLLLLVNSTVGAFYNAVGEQPQQRHLQVHDPGSHAGLTLFELMSPMALSLHSSSGTAWRVALAHLMCVPVIAVLLRRVSHSAMVMDYTVTLYALHCALSFCVFGWRRGVLTVLEWWIVMALCCGSCTTLAEYWRLLDERREIEGVVASAERTLPTEPTPA